jgi:hypothetical protein
VIPLLAWLIVVFIYAAFRPMPLMRIACRVDRELELKERLSTGLAFQQIRAPLAVSSALLSRQFSDAISHASSIQAALAFPFEWRPRQLASGAALLTLVIASVLLPNPMDLRIQARLAAQQAARQQAQKVEELKQAVQDAKELSPEMREELQRQLDELAKALQRNPGDLEQALADLSRFDEQIQRQVNPNAGTKQAFLDAMASRLAQLNGKPPQTDSAQAAQESLEQLIDQIEQMDGTQREQLSREVAQMAAQASQAGEAQLSQSLSALAQSLPNGDVHAAKGAAQQAQAAIRELDQQLNDQSALQSALAQSQTSQQALAQTGRQAAQGQGPSASQNPGSATGQGQNPGSGGGSKANQLPPFRGGRTNLPSPQGNAPSAQTGLLDDQVYAPWQRSTSTGQQSFIPGQDTGEGETTISEGQSPQSGISTPALVPYRQILPQYLNAANQAMQQGYIPGDMLDYVRRYFSSLEGN